MAAAASASSAAGSCLLLWREENDAVVRRWRRVAAERSGPEAKRAAQGCQRDLDELLRKSHAGLPAALPALPLELTILYNALLFDIQQPSSTPGEGDPLARMAHGLHRVLEACGAPNQGLSLEESWHSLFRERIPEELMGSLHQLAALQGALWLAAKHPEKAEGLFQRLSGGESPEPSLLHGPQSGLLALLQQWHPPEERDSDPLTVQSARNLKSVLWTSAAFLQGIQQLEAEDNPAALAFLQAAATGLCSKRLLAQIFTLMGCCSLKLGKPQRALQHLKGALRVDFTFLPALYQAALLYRQLGLVEAELESLELLDQVVLGAASLELSPLFLSLSGWGGVSLRCSLPTGPGLDGRTEELAGRSQAAPPGSHRKQQARLLSFSTAFCGKGKGGRHPLCPACLRPRMSPALSRRPAPPRFSRPLLPQALEGPAQAATQPFAPPFPVGAELLVCRPQRAALFAQNCPPGVKCLLAQRCLQAGRVSEASEHYLDLLALLQEQPHCQCGEPALPRIPEVFLEAASALVDLARPEEAIVLCEEVVARTSELVPKTLRMELASGAEEAPLGAEGSSPADPRGLLQKQKRESLRCVLWRAAAYLIQGWAWAKRGEAKEAVSYMSRCLNDLLKVHFVNTGSTEANMVQAGMPEGKVLAQVRQLALTGRGTHFLELGQEKEALRDFQHSLLVNPESPTANLYYMHTLWKVGRRQEATERWQKLRLDPALLEENPERSLPLHLWLYGRQMAFPHMESFTRNIRQFS